MADSTGKPGRLNLTIYQGADYVKPFVWKTGEPPLPVNMTGYTIRCQFRSKQPSPDILFLLTTENGRINITDPVNGAFQLRILAADTTLINFKSAVYDLEFISPSGFVTRLLEGSVTISPEVTR